MRFKLLSSNLITIIFITNCFILFLSEHERQIGCEAASQAAAQQQQPPSLCQSVWKFPPNCLNNCTYQLVWRFKPQEDAIEFIVSSKHAQRWTGIGFAQDKSLQNSDAIFAWIEDNSRYVMMDAFLPTYQAPISDKQQSISNISATVANGLISFRFTRKRNTGDSLEDLLFSDDKCLYLIYPIEGGTVDVRNRAVITNEFAPQISETPICIRSCNYRAPTAAPEPASSTALAAARPSQRPRLPFPPSSNGTTSRPTPPPSTTTTSTSTTTPKPTTTTTTTTTTTPKPTTTTTTTTTTTPKPTTTSTTTTTTSTTSTTQRPTTTSTSTLAPSSLPPATAASTTTSPPSTLSSSTETVPQPALEHKIDGEQQWCVGRWSHPANCRFQPRASADTIAYLQQTVDSSTNIRPLPLELSDCSYFAQWKYLDESDSIEFIIQTRSRYKWTGIGFSNGTNMANSDAIVGIIEETTGRHFIMDTWLEHHVVPRLDSQQSAEHTWAKRENQITTFRFQRKRFTNDSADFQFTDDACAYFFFPTQGGSFNAISKRLNKHEAIPSVSKHKICVRSCTKTGNALVPTTTTGDVQPETSSSTPNLSLVSSSTTPVSSSPSSSSSSSSSSPTNSAPPTTEKSLDATNPINLSPSNDFSAELDGSSSSSLPTGTNNQTPGGQQHQQTTMASDGRAGSPGNAGSNALNKLTFLSEPSIRWLAGIGCVATLVAMIVFQACFTVYKNKQAYKQNLYRQSAFSKQACLSAGHTNAAGPHYMADSGSQHQPSTGSEDTQIASLHNSSGTRAAAKAASAGHHHHQHQHLHQHASAGHRDQVPPLTLRSQQHQHQQRMHRHQQYYQQQHLQHYPQHHSQYAKHHGQPARQLHAHAPHQRLHAHQQQPHQHYSNNSQHRQHSQLATAATAGGVPYDLLRHTQHNHHHPSHLQQHPPPPLDEFTTSSQTDYSEQEDDEELDEEVFDEEENYYAARRARLYYN